MDNASKKEGKAVLFVSHNINYISSLCDSSLLLKNGQMQFIGDTHQAIYKYQQIDKNNNYKNLQTQTKNQYLVFKNFYLSGNENKNINGIYSNNEDIYINIDCEIKLISSDITLGYALYAESGELLYWTYQTDQEKKKWPKLHLGRNILRSKLPKRLLNEGNYSIEIIASIH
jgi:lipopolysaccharide transport system ATP-binding protein